MNVVIRNTELTPAQLAVLAVIGRGWSTAAAIWSRGPRFAIGSKNPKVKAATYLTVCASIRELVRLGYIIQRSPLRGEPEYQIAG